MIQWIRDHLTRAPSPAIVRAEQFQRDLGERVRRREREADETVTREQRRRSTDPIYSAIVQGSRRP